MKSAAEIVGMILGVLIVILFYTACVVLTSFLWVFFDWLARVISEAVITGAVDFWRWL